MQLKNPTSTFEIPSSYLKYLFAAAKNTKCKIFYLDANMLYGSQLEPYNITELDIGGSILPIPLQFMMTMVDEKLLDEYDSFTYYIDIPYVLIPSILDINNIEIKFSLENNDYILTRDGYEVRYIKLYKYGNTATIYYFTRFKSQLQSMQNILPMMEPPYRFDNLEEHPVIKAVYDDKTASNRRLITFSCGHRTAAFYIFKSLFFMMKGSKLTLDIMFDKFDSGKFMCIFHPIRLKNPVAKLNPFGNVVPYNLNVYCMYLNLAI